jgi:hypothetical protein
LTRFPQCSFICNQSTASKAGLFQQSTRPTDLTQLHMHSSVVLGPCLHACIRALCKRTQVYTSLHMCCIRTHASTHAHARIHVYRCILCAIVRARAHLHIRVCVHACTCVHVCVPVFYLHASKHACVHCAHIGDLCVSKVEDHRPRRLQGRWKCPTWQDSGVFRKDCHSFFTQTLGLLSSGRCPFGCFSLGLGTLRVDSGACVGGGGSQIFTPTVFCETCWCSPGLRGFGFNEGPLASLAVSGSCASEVQGPGDSWSLTLSCPSAGFVCVSHT